MSDGFSQDVGYEERIVGCNVWDEEKNRDAKFCVSTKSV